MSSPSEPTVEKWSKEAVLQFLDYYREEPVLWNAAHPSHKIRNDVYDAWKRIELLMDRQFTVNELKKKKESLMASFRTCVTKVRSRKRSGARKEYKPIWFAYEKMASFLMNKDDPWGTINSEDISSHLDNEFQDESLDYQVEAPGVIVEIANEGTLFTSRKETTGSQGSSSSQSSKKGDTDSLTGTLVTGNKSNAILVNPRQRGNPLLKSVTSVPWEYEEGVVPDYVLGRTTGALFLSLKYHNLKPEYINERIKQLGKLYQLRVLLVHVDMKDPHHSLKHLTRLCLLTDLTLMLAWSYEEAGKIIETYKAYEHKPPDLIMEKTESDPHVKLVSALTSVRSVNKTDAATLLNNFGSLERIIKASNHELCLCPGLGQQKATRLHTALHEPFLKGEKRQKLGIAKYFE